MTHEEFTGVTFNDIDPSGTRISRSSEFSVVNSTETALNILYRTKRIFCESGDYRQDNSLRYKHGKWIIIREDAQGAFPKPASIVI